jgi:hypothetical protein
MSFQIWSYNGLQLTSVTPGTTTPIDVERSGVMFSISLLSSTPDIESQISFVASPSINGGTLLCGGSGGETDSVTLMVGSIQGNVCRGRLCVCMKSFQVKKPTLQINLIVCVCMGPNREESTARACTSSPSCKWAGTCRNFSGVHISAPGELDGQSSCAWLEEFTLH